MSKTHEKVETNIGLMAVLAIIVISIGGLVQIVPLFFQKSMTEPVEGLKPYSALQLTGRDLYIRESCSVCHSQMIRPFRAETERYGHYSVAGEFVYDRPFQWGSKRTGPDLARVGGRYSDEWHRVHLINPRDVVPESIMPGFPWFASNKLDASDIQRKMQVLNMLGHRYARAEPEKDQTASSAGWQEGKLVPLYTEEEIAAAPGELEGKTEMDAIVAYLQVLGTSIKTRR